MTVSSRASAYRRLTAVAGLVLLVATIRVWLPQTVFPRVPLIGAAAGWPDGVDLLALLGAFGGLLLTFTPARRRFGWFVFGVAIAVGVLADQHRLQPWAWQFAVLAVVFCTAGDARQLGLARWLAVAVYLYSAFSKLDHAFLYGTGTVLVERGAEAIGLNPKWWTAGLRASLAAVLPIGELAVAVGLVVCRTRAIAAWGAVVMHIALLAMLHDHEWGVLLWNVFFIGQTLVLFTPWRAGSTSPLFGSPVEAIQPSNEENPESTPQTSPMRPSALWLGEIAVGLACFAPLLEPLGLFDHWPAWAVYSERTERVALLVPADGRGELPAVLAEYVTTPGPDGWCRVRLDLWSLDALGVPVYPQERFRLGVAAAVVERLPGDSAFRIVIDDVPDRWTGIRPRTVLETRAALDERLESFRLNAVPKKSVWAAQR